MKNNSKNTFNQGANAKKLASVIAITGILATGVQTVNILTNPVVLAKADSTDNETVYVQHIKVNNQVVNAYVPSKTSTMSKADFTEFLKNIALNVDPSSLTSDSIDLNNKDNNVVATVNQQSSYTLTIKDSDGNAKSITRTSLLISKQDFIDTVGQYGLTVPNSNDLSDPVNLFDSGANLTRVGLNTLNFKLPDGSELTFKSKDYTVDKQELFKEIEDKGYTITNKDEITTSYYDFKTSPKLNILTKTVQSSATNEQQSSSASSESLSAQSIASSSSTTSSSAQSSSVSSSEVSSSAQSSSTASVSSSATSSSASSQSSSAQSSSAESTVQSSADSSSAVEETHPAVDHHQKAVKKSESKPVSLPQTGDATNQSSLAIAGIITAVFASLLGMLGFKKRH